MEGRAERAEEKGGGTMKLTVAITLSLLTLLPVTLPAGQGTTNGTDQSQVPCDDARLYASPYLKGVLDNPSSTPEEINREVSLEFENRAWDRMVQMEEFFLSQEIEEAQRRDGENLNQQTGGN